MRGDLIELPDGGYVSWSWTSGTWVKLVVKYSRGANGTTLYFPLVVVRPLATLLTRLADSLEEL